MFFLIRLARGRDEWESAALQNANTKCNGLLPIWGSKVTDLKRFLLSLLYIQSEATPMTNSIFDALKRIEIV